MITKDIRADLQKLADKERARALQRFFKTGPGQYAERDIFLGIRVPDIRRLVKKYKSVPLGDVTDLLRSAVHEERLLALLLLVKAYSSGDEEAQERIYRTYLDNTAYINNWDLVDLSAGHIVGAFLMRRSREPLYALAKSGLLWERRISVLATFHFIRHDDFNDTLKIAEMLLSDREDLIHKAVGWMLREIGKRHLETEEKFLREHYRNMPRTMLRYAIEKFPEAKRQRYLKGKI
jgi:3-methyladenine DNA glycosylase AlkD